MFILSTFTILYMCFASILVKYLVRTWSWEEKEKNVHESQRLSYYRFPNDFHFVSNWNWHNDLSITMNRCPTIHISGPVSLGASIYQWSLLDLPNHSISGRFVRTRVHIFPIYGWSMNLLSTSRRIHQSRSTGLQFHVPIKSKPIYFTTGQSPVRPIIWREEYRLASSASGPDLFRDQRSANLSERCTAVSLIRFGIV